MLSLTGINYALLTGPAEEQLKIVTSDSVDLTVTSPPYDDLRSYNNCPSFSFMTCKKVISELYRVTKIGGVVVWIVADRTHKGSETGTSMRQALEFMRQGFNLHDTMIWHRASVPLTRQRYEQYWEYMFVFTKGKIKTFNGLRAEKKYPEKSRHKVYGRYPDDSRDLGRSGGKDNTKLLGNVWSIPAVHASRDKIAYKHPAIFPERLATPHIHSWSNPGDVVLDPFCGSGTVGKMALLSGRKFIGVDFNKEYINITKQRLRQRTGKFSEAVV